MGHNVEGIADAREAVAIFPPFVRDTLRADARIVADLLRCTPNHLECEVCRRATLRANRTYVGVFKHVATFWGQHLTGGHIAMIGDLGRGIDGASDALVVVDLYSASRVA